jgi:hypothetical protein
MVTLMTSYAAIYFAGGYLYSNGGTQNATLAQQYAFIAGNSINPGGSLFGSLSPFSSQVNGTASASASSFSLTSALGIILSFGSSLPNILNGIFLIVGSSFQYFGVPAAYFVLVGEILVLTLLVVIVITIIGIVYA